MVEVEVKYPLADVDRTEAQLMALGARPHGEREDVDQYFNAPDRDFARTDEALRIRQIGPKAYVTYKGPKRDALTKTRTEHEIPLTAATEKAFAELLVHLKYRPVAVVRKRRRLFNLEVGAFQVEICLDQVTGVGSFLELEIVTEEAQVPAARAAILDLARQLGLGESERRSYLEMFLTRHGTDNAASRSGG
jgi:adenylate cyclase class 2